jgi:hypothetical protein
MPTEGVEEAEGLPKLVTGGFSLFFPSLELFPAFPTLAELPELELGALGCSGAGTTSSRELLPKLSTKLSGGETRRGSGATLPAGTWTGAGRGSFWVGARRVAAGKGAIEVLGIGNICKVEELGVLRITWGVSVKDSAELCSCNNLKPRELKPTESRIATVANPQLETHRFFHQLSLGVAVFISAV